MAFVKQWFVRLAALAGAMLASVLVPTVAWASSGPGSVVVEAARRRPRGFGSVLGALCCLVVIGIIVVVVLLVMRGRRSGGRR
jgi:hypothetical protein